MIDQTQAPAGADTAEVAVAKFRRLINQDIAAATGPLEQRVDELEQRAALLTTALDGLAHAAAELGEEVGRMPGAERFSKASVALSAAAAEVKRLAIESH